MPGKRGTRRRAVKSKKAAMRRKAVKGTRQKRMTTTGRIMPPIDVVQPSQIGDLMDRIKKGGVTIVLVYAKWCGHCTEFMPHFDAAAMNPHRSVQVAKVNEKMVDHMNSAIKKMNSSAEPVSVEGYPSVLAVDTNGNVITKLNAIKDTDVMTRVMNETGNLTASNASIASTASNAPTASTASTKKSSLPPIIAVNTSRKNDIIKDDELASMQTLSSDPDEVVNSYSGDEMPVLPPSKEVNSEISNSNSQMGGSLFSMMKKNKNRKTIAADILKYMRQTVRKLRR